MADGMSDVALELRREGGHPADDHRRSDAIVQSREMAGAQPAHGQAHATDPLLVHFRTRQQIVHRTNVIPEDDARPGKAGRVNGSPDELLTLAGALIESGDS